MAGSRPEHDLQLFTDDKAQWPRILSRENEQYERTLSAATGGYREQSMEPTRSIEHEPKREQTREHSIDMGMAV